MKSHIVTPNAAAQDRKASVERKPKTAYGHRGAHRGSRGREKNNGSRESMPSNAKPAAMAKQVRVGAENPLVNVEVGRTNRVEK